MSETKQKASKTENNNSESKPELYTKLPTTGFPSYELDYNNYHVGTKKDTEKSDGCDGC